ncbi:hypothetical protein RU07_01250 [Agrobacterium tumefaciens]|uniref:Uncharacterized protein n=1 Tax=Agrobacterium tumefaciens TaxID=358 RepID=A0A0D0L3N6_AGRTU|nr:hypothetical protein RU07_01250 [Agrobacterium tumefaciens]
MQALAQPGTELLIEPRGSRRLRNSPDWKFAEIQVKDASGKFCIKELAEYLGHPGSKVARNTLLERFLVDRSCFVVLVL